MAPLVESDHDDEILQSRRWDSAVSGRVQVMRYCASVGLVVVALLATYFCHPLQQKQSFLPIMAAVATASWLGGFGPSIVAILVAAAGWAWLLAPPTYNLALSNYSDVVRLVLFVLVGMLVNSLHAARARAELALKKSQQRLALSLEAAQMGVWTYDIRTGIFWLSPRMKRILGIEEYNSSTTYGCFLSRIYPEDRPHVVQAMTCTLEDNAKYEVEHRVLSSSQPFRWVTTRGRTFVNNLGEVECMMGVAIDISDRKNSDTSAATN